MPLPGSKPGGSGLTRSEAAILAWKKRPRAKPKNGALDPKIAARVKQILAAKQKKGPKPKAGKAKPKGTKQEIANQNRAAIAKQSGIDDGVIVRLGAGMNSDLEKGAHDELIKKGLATRGADGKPKLTAAGKKWRSAADKGDAEGAGAALAEGRAGASEGAAKEKAKSDKANERATAKQAKQAEAGKKKQAVAQRAKQQQAQRAKMKQAAEKVKAERATAKDAAAKEKASAKEASGKERAAKPAKEQAANRAKVAQDMAEQDAGLSPSGSAALGDFADGKPLSEQAGKDFEAMGLTEKDEQGNHRLTTDGRAAANAMNKGDTRAAIDAISRAGSKKKKVDTTPTKALEDIAMLRHRLSAIKGLLPAPIFSLLNAQITRERYAEAAYTSIATWADAQSFPGLQAWATDAAAEERVHAQAQIAYLNDRGTVALESLDAPPLTYPNYAAVLNGALDLERIVTAALTDIVYRARSSGDEATALFIGGFLPEQVKAEKELQTYIARVQRGAPIDLLDAELYDGANA